MHVYETPLGHEMRLMSYHESIPSTEHTPAQYRYLDNLGDGSSAAGRRTSDGSRNNAATNENRYRRTPRHPGLWKGEADCISLDLDEMGARLEMKQWFVPSNQNESDRMHRVFRAGVRSERKTLKTTLADIRPEYMGVVLNLLCDAEAHNDPLYGQIERWAATIPSIMPGKRRSGEPVAHHPIRTAMTHALMGDHPFRVLCTLQHDVIEDRKRRGLDGIKDPMSLHRKALESGEYQVLTISEIVEQIRSRDLRYNPITQKEFEQHVTYFNDMDQAEAAAVNTKIDDKYIPESELPALKDIPIPDVLLHSTYGAENVQKYTRAMIWHAVRNVGAAPPEIFSSAVMTKNIDCLDNTATQYPATHEQWMAVRDDLAQKHRDPMYKLFYAWVRMQTYLPMLEHAVYLNPLIREQVITDWKYWNVRLLATMTMNQYDECMERYGSSPAKLWEQICDQSEPFPVITQMLDARKKGYAGIAAQRGATYRVPEWHDPRVSTGSNSVH